MAHGAYVLLFSYVLMYRTISKERSPPIDTIQSQIALDHEHHTYSCSVPYGPFHDAASRCKDTRDDTVDDNHMGH